MAFKSKTRPLCRYCGKGIAKRTTWKWLVTKQDVALMDNHFVCEKLPQTKAEAQKLFNEQVTAVKRRKHTDWETDEVTDLGIDQVTLWDGESWVDEFFCNGDHAKCFAYLLAREGRCTNSYNAALRKQIAERATEETIDHDD